MGMINYSRLCKFIGKSKERILSKLNKSTILRLYSVVHVAMETTKTSNFTCQLKSFISIFFTSQVSACELQPFKSVFSHLKPLYNGHFLLSPRRPLWWRSTLSKCHVVT